MGSWSVYCGISRITIRSGQRCVLLPLKKSTINDYIPYLPATLPIFGEYDDYGGIENIEENENTKMIEKHFNCTIHDFAYFFTRGCISSGDVDEDLSKNKEIKDWTFMFIDREVYDFMGNYVPSGWNGGGSLEFGNPKILELIGFNYIGEKEPVNENDKRYKYVWELKGEKFYSDGEWLHHDKGNVYNFSGDCSSCLSDYIEIPEDKKWIGEKAMWQLWEHLDEDGRAKHLFRILGRDYSDWMFHNRFAVSMKSMAGVLNVPDEPKTLLDKYLKDVPTFGKWMCELTTIRHNMHCMSGYFEPHQLYLTPQCGEYEDHQVFLNKFAEINQAIVDYRKQAIVDYRKTE